MKSGDTFLAAASDYCQQHLMFSSAQCFINGEKITDINEEYPYKAYLSDLLGVQ